jgi:formamidopyrimidine-DNA glycosylase
MPELPEVETIVRDLRQEIAGRTIKRVKFLNKDVWRRESPPRARMVGASIESLERRGKNILIHLSNGQTMIVHLMMTGRLTWEQSETKLRKHTHLVIDLDFGQLRFNDTRRFGYLDLAASKEIGELDYLESLGPDALVISKNDFVRLVRSRKRIIKSMLLDQRFISGLGNIYTDEALFLAGIHPRRVSSSLSIERTGRLHSAMIKVLNEAIESRGSSVDNYVDGRGQKGSFQSKHLVYGREDKPCFVCGKAIRRQTIGSRSSHYCPRCQR